MTDLPLGWEWATLGQLCEVVGGATPRTDVQDYWGGEVAWITPNDLAHYDGKTITSGARYLTTAGFASSATRMLPRGSVLFSSRAPIGYVVIADAPVCTNQGFKSVIPPLGMSSDYLYWYLKYATPMIQARASGTTFKEISKRGLESLPLPVAPQAEQQRIVAAVEEHLSRLDAAERALESATRRLDALAARLLDTLIEGEEVRLGDVLREPLRNGFSARTSDGGKIRVVTLTAVTRAKFIDEYTKVVDPPNRSIERLWMEPGDLFIQRSNTPELVGSAAMYRGAHNWAIFPDLLIRARTNDRADPAYVELVLRSSRLRHYFRDSAQGIAGSMPKISQSTIENAPLRLPDRARQAEIVSKFETRAVAVDRQRQAIACSHARSRLLRRAILGAAFSGRLVPQDPADKPASVLLERIAAERVSAPATTRRKAVTS